MEEKITDIWKKIFSRWEYSLEAITIAITFYTLNAIIPNWDALRSIYETTTITKAIIYLVTLSIHFGETIAFHSYVSLIIISILLGILFTLITFKVKNHERGENAKAGVIGSVGGTIGVTLATLAPGCAACGVGLISALGIGAGAIQIFPYDGLELSVLAIIILGVTIIKTTKDMTVCKACEV
jgi:hypothetical protein